jgi:hypothetical protein
MKKNSKIKKGEPKVVEDKVEVDEEPSWYHYVIVLLVFFAIVYGVFFLYHFFTVQSYEDVKNSEEYVAKYYYKHKIGNVTYNIQITLPEEDILNLKYHNDISHFDLLNSYKYTFLFENYTGGDNGFVTISSIKLRRFLSTIYFANFNNESFKEVPEISCKNSTFSKRVITFRVNQNVSGIFEDENGCIIFSSRSAKELPLVVDYALLSVLKEEEEFKLSE